MSGGIMDILTTFAAFIMLHYVVILTTIVAVHCVVTLLLVHSRAEMKPWQSALESWKKARHEWKSARASLSQVTRDLTAEAANGEAQETQETIRKLQTQEQTAWKAEKTAAKRVCTAGKSVYMAASNDVMRKLKYFRVDARRLCKKVVKLAVETGDAFKSMIAWIMKHHPLLAGVILALVALANDYIYYSRFNFDILPYHSDPAGGTLIMVVSVILAVTVALLVILSTVIFTVFVIVPSIILLLIISLGCAVEFGLGQSSAWALGFYCRSVRLSQFIQWLASTFEGGLKVLQGLLKAIDEKVTGLLEWIRKTNVPIRKAVWGLSLLLAIPALVYLTFIEPQYRAYDAYYGDNRVTVVVNQPPEGDSDPMIKIGSNRSYVFVVRDQSRSTRAAGGCAGATGSQEKSDWIEVVVKSFCNRVKFFWSNLLPENDSAEDKDFIRDFLNTLWQLLLSVPDLPQFIFGYRPPDFDGAVIALPPPRVHCVYEDGSGPAAELCEPPADRPPRSNSEDEERLLREQLAAKIGCQKCQKAIVSKPFVFMPGKWKHPIRLRQKEAQKQICEFRQEHQSSLWKAQKRTLYVFGFASADGPAGHNEKLALDRAKTIQDLVKPEFPKWNIKTKSLGEDHLTNRVAHSRSARLVFCAEQGD